jgi:hypothetical protein
VKAILKRARDYVWTKGARDNFVGGLAVVVVTGLVVWIWTKYDPRAAIAAWTAVKSATAATWAWLTVLVAVPRWLVWLVALPLVVYIGRAINRGARDVLDQRRRRSQSQNTIQQVIDGAKSTIRHELVATKSSDPAPAFLVKLLGLLADVYPNPMEIGAVSVGLSLTYIVAEKLVEEVEAAGLVTILLGSYTYSPKSVLLTTKGRDYYLEHNLDLV